jgi:cation-transporting ATPase E
VLRFAAPAGVVAAAATFATYVTVHRELGVGLAQSRTSAAITLAGVGFTVLAIVASPLNPGRLALIAWMAGSFALVLAVPPLRDFFALPIPPPAAWLESLAVVGVAAVALWVAIRPQLRAQRDGEGEGEGAPRIPLKRDDG